MKKIILYLSLSLLSFVGAAQGTMTAELLWQLGRVSPLGLSTDKTKVVYGVTYYNSEENTKSTSYYTVPLKGGTAVSVADPSTLIADKNVSPDGKYKLSHQAVKIQNVAGKDYYPDLDRSEAMIYDDLMYRHWDTWADGSYNHVFLTDLESGEETDIMNNKVFHCPTQPFGGDEDYIWNPRSHQVLYVTKSKTGAAYATSTNTDIFVYDLNNLTTTNLTKGMEGYDNSPAFSPTGVLAWLSMKRDGYESDKNDIVVEYRQTKYNLTEHWDGTVESFLWGEKGKKIYFVAPVGGAKHLFMVDFPGSARKMPVVRQITKGQFDVVNIVGQSGTTLVVGRSDMNHATELYAVNLKDGSMKQLTHVNDVKYKGISMSKVEKRMVSTTDNKKMVTWVIYPPDFDPKKKYPTLLYCQGGPQGALSQFYSYRWNFQLMAAKGYIIVAPNRRGMPGHGVEWNEQISTDYGGQNMQDYLAAIDDVAKEEYVDKDRLGAVGASYGGYSVFYLAGMHEGRFKSFIAHDGIFNWRSMYGTTEEMFFVNWDLGGAYWEEENEKAQRSFGEFNPINQVSKWDTPIMIVQGGKDYRVPIGQGLEAFQAAQLQGIKSRLLYLPEENHWVLSAQNALVWQREFFRWLSETL
ncbi:alpha/beta fold hydrolase [Reichenbachiella agarivorans]|uniref:Alpha/beta fold hydrolase n=1 Tax=Reichenbachiella agarivorans TaxID=2979464 RepID=A0ABY6CQU5_9BACT|nr:alpha/beta fold hydrolase [Reichenbachiella agarivorans]UXP30675.1 alpha/beta fold hydrolase [Reichenbachiella agarivorans]